MPRRVCRLDAAAWPLIGFVTACGGGRTELIVPTVDAGPCGMPIPILARNVVRVGVDESLFPGATRSIANVEVFGSNLPDASVIQRGVCWLGVGAALPTASAGVVSVQGFGDLAPPSYDSIIVGDVAWQPGQPISVSVSGGDAPSFTGQIEIPRPIALMTSFYADGGTPTIRIADGITFSWTPEPGCDTIGVLGAPSDGPLRYWLCSFPISDGTGTVPSDVLTFLPPGMMLVGVERVSATSQFVGNWHFNLSGATWLYSGTVQFQ